MARTLPEWLRYIEGLHPHAVDMGLERVVKVRDALGLAFEAPVIMVGGTNGKGSVCAMLESMLHAAGYRVGLYTSPHLLRYNERVRIDAAEADDGVLAAAFEKVEAARADTALTYFEFGTLAACLLFAQAKPDAIILEVGLGGRLDAVNAFEPDCAIVTSIGIDHVEYLGPTREHIGREKAGIFRSGRAAICGDPDPPASLLEHARAIGAELQIIGRDFAWEGDRAQWRYRGRGSVRAGLAAPALRGLRQLANASVCLAALDALRERLPVNMQAVREGLAQVQLPGRFQVLPGAPAVVLDVAHNPQAAAVLAENLRDMGAFARTRGVIGMLQDKDIDAVCAALAGRIDDWYVASLGGPRGASAERLAQAVERSGAGGTISRFDSPRLALAEALSKAGRNDRIVVFGSFLTVADVMAARAAGA